jgi:hypothetical protein
MESVKAGTVTHQLKAKQANRKLKESGVRCNHPNGVFGVVQSQSGWNRAESSMTVQGNSKAKVRRQKAE